MADASCVQTEATLSKKEKGRLKKLLKKANQVVPKEFSGIVTSEDFEELQRLAATTQQPILGPSIHWRNAQSDSFIDVSDHRGILYRLLESTVSSTHHHKRKLVEFSSKVPTWACLHNVAAVRHVAVIELHVSNSLKAKVESLFERYATCKTRTRWFSGLQQPKPISHGLMYAKPKQNRDKEATKAVDNMKDLYQALLLLRLSEDHFVSERYPRLKEGSLALKSAAALTVDDSTTEDLLQPSDYEEARAKLLVSDYHVMIQSTDREEDTLPGYVATVSTAESCRIFAMDCEMVRTTVGLELARVTMIQLRNFASHDQLETKVVFDYLVKPPNMILDYLTQYSGIDAASYESQPCVSLAQVQAALLQLSTTDIVIGHSFENDLRALRWVHPLVIDTAILFRHQTRSFKFSLRHLASTLLKRQIQTSNHCSEEDALATLQLTVCRAIKGPSFGIFNYELVNRLVDFSTRGETVVCVGPSEWLQENVTKEPNSIHALSCESLHDANHKAVVAWLTGKSRRAELVWANWKAADENDFAKLEEIVVELMSKATFSDTILAIAVQANVDTAIKLSKERKVRLNPKATIGWSESEEKTWQNAVETALTGRLMWIGDTGKAKASH